MIYHNYKPKKYGEISSMKDEKFLKLIGRNIARLRKEKGLTQKELGLVINMEKPNISAIENGRQNPTVLTLKKIADAIGCEVVNFVLP